MPHNVLYDGQEAAPPQPVALRAGPLALVYQAGDLRYIRLGEREIVRRIYFAARDAHWGTAPNIIERQSIETGSRTFQIIYVARSRLGEVALYWQAEIRGAGDGTITYRVRGRAERAFCSNRLGLCLLHPAAECAGARCRVTHSAGAIEEGRLPERIAPHQPFMDIRAISHEVDADVWATATLDGETFEMEDQRNWTDASFKTYTRPLALPYPYEVGSGVRFDQRITLTLEGAGLAATTAAAAAATAALATAAPALATIQAPGDTCLPAIGLGVGAPLTDSAAAALRALALGHLRVAPDVATTAETRARWASEARALALPLELALLPTADDAAPDRALAWIAHEGLTLARVLACTTPDTDVPGLVARARAAAGAVPVLVGVDGYFTHLNRERPGARVGGARVGGAEADGVFYSLNPQVHAFDNDSLIETLPTQAETVRSAQALYPGLAVAVTPITLRPRTMAAADPRQGSLLGAGWTLGSIASLAGAGVGSLTYYQTVGAPGIIAADGERYPVYHLLGWLAGWRGATVCPVAVSAPLRLQGLALRQGARQRLILANVSGSPLEVAVAGLGADARVLALDERNAAAARCGVLGAPTALPTSGGCAAVMLWPYGLACIDATLAP